MGNLWRCFRLKVAANGGAQNALLWHPDRVQRNSGLYFRGFTPQAIFRAAHPRLPCAPPLAAKMGNNFFMPPYVPPVVTFSESCTILSCVCIPVLDYHNECGDLSPRLDVVLVSGTILPVSRLEEPMCLQMLTCSLTIR